jgi:hypothetical protein
MLYKSCPFKKNLRRVISLFWQNQAYKGTSTSVLRRFPLN